MFPEFSSQMMSSIHLIFSLFHTETLFTSSWIKSRQYCLLFYIYFILFYIFCLSGMKDSHNIFWSRFQRSKTFHICWLRLIIYLRLNVHNFYLIVLLIVTALCILNATASNIARIWRGPQESFIGFSSCLHTALGGVYSRRLLKHTASKSLVYTAVKRHCKRVTLKTHTSVK